MTPPWQKTVLCLGERSDLRAEHRGAVLAGLAVASPLSGATSRHNISHFYGFLSMDPTVQG